MQSNRVVITGLGVVTGCGNTPGRLWHTCLSEACPAGPFTRFDAGAYDTRFGVEVTGWDPVSYLPRAVACALDRFAQFGAAAAVMALEDACVRIDPSNRERVAIYLGAGIGGLNTIEDQHRRLLAAGPSAVDPGFIFQTTPWLAARTVAAMFDIRGPINTYATACASSAHSIGEAFHLLKRGDADVAIAGGSETITELGLAGFCAARSLSTRNDDPVHASRPFDATRDGFVVAEGAGVIVMETQEHAEKRGAPVHAELLGYGASGDAYHLTAPAPDGRGAALAMRAALRSARLAPEQVDYINAHGTSTPRNDKIETTAIKSVFWTYHHMPAVSSTKSVTGHLTGAAGAVEAIICTLAIRSQIVPPTANFTTPDPHCDIDVTPNEPRSATIDVALTNSFGFGGHNASLLIGKFKP